MLDFSKLILPCPCWAMVPVTAHFLLVWGMETLKDAPSETSCPHFVVAPPALHVLRIN